MIELAIRQELYGGHSVTHYFNPQKDYDAIYDFLTERLGWSHEEAEEVASWAEVAYYEEEYDTDHPNVEIYFVEE